MKSFRFKTRMGKSAALTAILLTTFASQSYAGVSARDDLQIAPSMAELTPGKFDTTCLPPSDLVACAAWHQVIRANFSPREIGILFGTATSYPEYATSYARIKSRYERLHDEFAAERLGAHTASVD